MTREQQAADFAAELGEFIDWLACECFPFEWRYDRVAKALDLLEMNPRAYPLIETLDQLSGEHLPEVMNILQTLISKSGDEIRWSYREERMKPLLRRGLTSTETTVRKVTAEIQETLLRHGCFEYLHLDS